MHLQKRIRTGREQPKTQDKNFEIKGNIKDRGKRGIEESRHRKNEMHAEIRGTV